MISIYIYILIGKTVGRCHVPPYWKMLKSPLFGGNMTKGITVHFPYILIHFIPSISRFLDFFYRAFNLKVRFSSSMSFENYFLCFILYWINYPDCFFFLFIILCPTFVAPIPSQHFNLLIVLLSNFCFVSFPLHYYLLKFLFYPQFYLCYNWIFFRINRFIMIIIQTIFKYSFIFFICCCYLYFIYEFILSGTFNYFSYSSILYILLWKL